MWQDKGTDKWKFRLSRRREGNINRGNFASALEAAKARNTLIDKYKVTELNKKVYYLVLKN